ncbi:MAG: hypothetical protein AAGC57_03545 [Pseudomonadota bacterium]
MPPAADTAALLQEWTWRQIPWRIARGLTVASAAAVALFALHVGGWGLTARLAWDLFGSAFLIGLPVAMLVSFLAGAPALRAMLARGRLRRGVAVRLGALAYGGIAFLWMAALRPGPPAFLDPTQVPEPSVLAELAVHAYRHVLTPLVFALYGAASGWLGWHAAFGRRTAIGD